GFAGNDAPSFVFPTAISTKGAAPGGASGGSRPGLSGNRSFASSSGGNLSAKRGTEDLDYFIGDEAMAMANAPGYGLHYPIRHGQVDNWVRHDKLAGGLR